MTRTWCVTSGKSCRRRRAVAVALRHNLQHGAPHALVSSVASEKEKISLIYMKEIKCIAAQQDNPLDSWKTLEK